VAAGVTSLCAVAAKQRKKPAILELDRIDKASVPLFIVTMAAEAWILRRRTKRTLGDMYDATPEALSGAHLPADELVPLGYERRDTVASLAMLTGSVAIGFTAMGLFGRFDRFLFRHRISNFGSHRGSLATAMVLWDFLYYWEHRWMHEVRLFWAHHVTHHSSERYNLSTALRQPWSPFLVFWVFAPFPLLGYSPETKYRAGQLNLLYQYWIHTEVVGRLHPTLEKVLNTPSHHRVHHGANQQYLDKNYGGILIVWDKLFGSFEPELRRIKYGLTKNISTYNPLRVGYHEFAAIARDVRGARRWRDRAGHVFHRPGWSPATSAQPLAA
jgi:sterol desaturase/sphingolipid hydroxylase (fatty acid hydroxylase superfamily)